MAETINDRIAHYRKLFGLTQSEVAERIGMKTSTYSQMERKGKITAENVVKLSEIFRVDPTILLFGEPDKDAPTEPINDPIIKQPPVITPPEPEPIVLTNKEKIIINILREVSTKDKNDIIEFIQNKIQ